MPQPEPLLNRTERLLRRYMPELTLRVIAERAGVGFEWLRKYSQGKFDDPGVKRIQRLHDFLALYDQAQRNVGANTNEERAPAA